MIELGREQRHIIKSLCENSKEVLVQGAVEGDMGQVWVPVLENPGYCLIHHGDFSFLVGIAPNSRESLELKEQLLESCSRDFITPSDKRWGAWLDENFAGEFRLIARYALKKDKHNFETEKLLRYVSQVPKEIKIKKIDEKIYELVLKEEWSRDFCSSFQDADRFLADGLGYVAMKGSKVLSGCSAYGSSEGMMEVQVETRKDCQRKGLGLACSAKFILECLERGIYPNWDAANIQSVGLAEKLGYVFDREYIVYQFLDCG